MSFLIKKNGRSGGGSDSFSFFIVQKLFACFYFFPFHRLPEQPEQDWGKIPNKHRTEHAAGKGHDPSRMLQPQFGQFEPLSRTQEIPRSKIDILRASVESMPSYPVSRDQRGQGQGHLNDLHSNPSHHGSRDQLDSDYHSNPEEPHHHNPDFHGNVYSIPSNLESGQGHAQSNLGGHTSQGDMPRHANIPDREHVLRQSIEDFAKFKEAYQVQQIHEGHQGHYYGNGDYQCSMPVHQHYHAAEQPYDQGHYYHSHEQIDPVHHHGYGGHYHGNHLQETHHHFRNIYTDRPYHTIGERGETEGGNVVDDIHFYHHGYQQVPHGYHDNSVPTKEHTGDTASYQREQKFHIQTGERENPEKSGNTNSSNHSNISQQSSGGGRKLPQVTYRFQNVAAEARNQGNTGSKKSIDKVNKEGKEKGESSVKVKYERDGGGRHTGHRRDTDLESDPNMEKEFMEQGESLGSVSLIPSFSVCLSLCLSLDLSLSLSASHSFCLCTSLSPLSHCLSLNLSPFLSFLSASLDLSLSSPLSLSLCLSLNLSPSIFLLSLL